MAQMAKGKKIGRNKAKCEKYRTRKGHEGSKHPKAQNGGTDIHLYTHHADGKKTIRRPFVIGDPTHTIGGGPSTHLSTVVMMKMPRVKDRQEEATSLAMSLRPHLRERVTA